MKITELIKNKQNNISGERTPLIAFLGDSVTQGCFELYVKDDGNIGTSFHQNNAYHKKIAEILSYLYPKCPINIINAGISGDTAQGALERLERDVLKFSPDLTVVCLGLNDSMLGKDNIDNYYSCLKEIFNRLKKSGSEVIFMTPNMMNTKVSCTLEKPVFISTAKKTMEIQNSGVFDGYIEKARQAASECCVRICDVYFKWKTLEENGVDVTALLSNEINHPRSEMHMLFAYSLVEEIMK